MGRPKKDLRTDLGNELAALHARSNNLTVRLGSVLQHGYVKKDEVDELVGDMDGLEQSMKDARASLTEDDWEQ